MRGFPAWKTSVVAVALAFGFLFGLPNIYPDEPAVQVSSGSSNGEVLDSDIKRARAAVEKAGLQVLGWELEGNQALIRFESIETQIAAKQIIQETLGDNYITALNLAPTTPESLRSIGANPLKLGLDLRGGVHFLMEVDLDAAIAQRLESYASEIKQMLRKERIRFRSVEVVSGDLEIRFLNTKSRDQGAGRIREDYMGVFAFREADRNGAPFSILILSDGERANIQEYAVSQNLTTLRNRVNELGVSEPLVQRQGKDRIVVELPGVQDTATAKRVLGATANLEFRLEALPDAAPRGIRYDIL